VQAEERRRKDEEEGRGGEDNLNLTYKGTRKKEKGNEGCFNRNWH